MQPVFHRKQAPLGRVFEAINHGPRRFLALEPQRSDDVGRKLGRDVAWKIGLIGENNSC